MKDNNIAFEDAQKLHESIIKKIIKFDQEYYENDNPIINDAEYDQLVSIAKSLEIKFPALASNSIFSKVSGVASEKFKKYSHRSPMLSLANIFDKDEIPEFIKRIQKFLKISYIPEIYAELKIDGLSFSLIYERGILKHAATRGDGYIGEEITENIKTINSIPQKIDTKLELVEIRGEIYISKEDFINLNYQQEKEGKNKFSNPRNAAAGSVRQLDSKITSSRPLKYFVYSIAEPKSLGIDKQSDLIKLLKSWNFNVNPYNKLCYDFDQLYEFYNKIEQDRDLISYEIDGVVYKLNDLLLSDRLGFVGRTPRHSVAHKFPALISKTKLNDIIIQVGRTGAITPVAILDPIYIGGVKVSRASLHNFDEIVRNDIRIGDNVYLKRAGDVIPQIHSVIYEDRKSDLPEFLPPRFCPSCGSELYKNQEDAILRCENSNYCPNQICESIIHFASKDCLNIEGLGRKQIEFLIEKKYIKNSIDLLDLQNSIKLDNLKQELGWGELSVSNILNAIEKSKKTAFYRVIFALGIRHIGEVASKEISKIFINPDEFLESMKRITYEDSEIINKFKLIQGFGEKTLNSIIKFFKYEPNIYLLGELLKRLEIAEEQKIESTMSGKVIVFTGAMQIMSRQEAKQHAEKLGARVGTSISKNVDLLVVGENPGSKLKEAERLNIKIFTEKEWLEEIG